MKPKYWIVAQIILLAGTVAAGFVLKSDINQGPRLLHQGFGMLSGLACIVSAVLLARTKAPKLQTSLAWGAVLLTFLAGLAGKSLEMTQNYNQMFAMMRITGGLALLVSAGLLIILKREPRAN